jgi:heme-degrading monooxygenase HmoA
MALMPRSPHVTSIEDPAPKARVVVMVWDSLEQIEDWRDSTQPWGH